MKSPQGSVPKWPKSSLVWPTLQWPQAVMADADEPHAPGPTSDSTSGGLHPLTAGLLARHDRRCAPTATALSKRQADWPAAEQEMVGAHMVVLRWMRIGAVAFDAPYYVLGRVASRL